MGVGAGSEDGVGCSEFCGVGVVDGVSDVPGVAVGAEGVVGFVDGSGEVALLEAMPELCLFTPGSADPVSLAPSSAAVAFASDPLGLLVAALAVATVPVRRPTDKVIASSRPTTVVDRSGLFRR